MIKLTLALALIGYVYSFPANQENQFKLRLIEEMAKNPIPHFKNFLKTYGKKYTGDELVKRFEIFQDNLKIIHEHQRNELGSATYGLTEFADMTPEEFRKAYLSSEWVETDYPTEQAEFLEDTGDVPDTFDWRDHNAVTEVKNQGQCGSCWSFSTTGNIEGQWAIKKKQLISLSEQELVDCDHVDHGCQGGLPSNAYKVIMQLGGLETEKAYPYTARGGTCKFQKSKVVVDINGAIKISSDEDQMKIWLYKNGPISIGINAAAMQYYFGGVSKPLFCNKKRLDHGVLIVGYGAKKAGIFGKMTPYWIIKNSWGPNWGEKGYYLVERGTGACGLNTMCTSAVVNA